MTQVASLAMIVLVTIIEVASSTALLKGSVPVRGSFWQVQKSLRLCSRSVRDPWKLSDPA